jgi:hypothetical protein
MPRGRFGKAVALALVVAMGGFTAGCFGTFQLTRNLYEVNRSVDDKYVRSVLTWILVIPYALTGALDFLAFNVIEFWTGQNPVAPVPVEKVRSRRDGKDVMTLSREGDATLATLERYQGKTLVSTVRIRDDGKGTVRAVETAGGIAVREISAVRRDDGSVEVTTKTGGSTTTERFAASALRVHAVRVARIAAEARQAAGGASGTIPLAAAARVPALGG